MGWHGSFMTAGMALGAPVAGLAIDTFGWEAGFTLVAIVGLLVAVAGAAATRVLRRRLVAAQTA
jgi:MFS family permease